MPFLFERVGDETELLLPDNLLHTDSLVRQLVTSIDEELWQDIEIIGWLYQFYISEKKDQVIGKVVKSEDIPAATQLFTPNWIVKYMVQNSLGAQWLATYPQSPLKGQMEYYIEPAEQTDEVNAQLAAITPSQLNPEELTLIDPACGSGHILVEAYELFKAIYLERGYRQRDVPQLILEKNLFGLDIDERAAQLTGFALMMKGRADDRQLLGRGVKLNVMALVDSAGLDAEALAKGLELSDYGLKPADLTELMRLFEHATTFGSLIQVPEGLAYKLSALKTLSEATSQDLFVSEALKRLDPLVQQAELLAAQYDAVVANPPYMTSDYFPASLKNWVKAVFAVRRTDLYALFIERALRGSSGGDRIAIISRDSWMFLPTYEVLREQIVLNHTILSMAHLGSGAFESIGGQVVRATVFSLHASGMPGYQSSFFNLVGGDHLEKEAAFLRREHRIELVQERLSAIPGCPMAFDASDALRNCFAGNTPIGEVAELREGIHTGHNDRFMRYWWEVSLGDFSRNESSTDSIDAHGKKWIPYNKGGEQRKWYGNNDYVIAFDRHSRDAMASLSGHVRPSQHLYFLEGGTWTDVGSGTFSVRYYPPGFLFDGKGMAVVAPRIDKVLGAMNSKPFQRMANMLMPTLNYKCGTTKKLPYVESSDTATVVERVVEAKGATRIDWDAYERSWDFQSLPLLTAFSEPTPTIESSYTAWIAQNRDTISEMKRLEEENNRLFIDAYGLADELTPDVPIEQITLTVNPAYRYGGKLTEEQQWTRFREDTMQELVSYAVGCMMGRYSLDAPGLIYAHSGNEGFDPSRYPTFPADEDGIVPLTDTEWFDDDASHRLIEFISVTWDKSHLEANLTFLADNLSPKKSESSRETIRRYLCDKFFKDQLQTYKKRPIYWLFSSGKQKAFQCLVYLHRYNAGTLARMRSEYVIPLQGKMAARLEKLQGDIQAATSTAQSKRLEKERAKLDKQHVELLAFDEKLRHYADRRISLDLDDGVKVNYGKFGNLLAEVKAVHGKHPEVS
jgi:type II restriction/modification system DNA methylase subunit YeeA